MRLRLPTTIAGQAKLEGRPQPLNRVVVQHGAANALAEARLATEPGTPVVLVPVRGRAKDRRVGEFAHRTHRYSRAGVDPTTF